MTVGLIVLVTSVLLILALGVLIGYRLSKWKISARAKRQAAAQISLYRQLNQLQSERQRSYSGMNVGSFS
jgi:Tfp pilus assembly protein PilV